MKHIVEIKMPNLFGRKKKVEIEASDDPNIEEVIVETSKRIEDVSNVLKVVAPLVAVLAVGYVAGYNRGMLKGVLKDKSERIIIISNREEV